MASSCFYIVGIFKSFKPSTASKTFYQVLFSMVNDCFSKITFEKNWQFLPPSICYVENKPADLKI